jgi:hypothetical protein
MEQRRTSSSKTKVWNEVVEDLARVYEAKLCNPATRLNRAERRYLARFNALANCSFEVSNADRLSFFRNRYHIRPAPYSWLTSLRAVGEYAAAECLVQALGAPTMHKEHRWNQEDRQIAFFNLPPALAVRQHRHVLEAGSNWRNLFSQISDVKGPAEAFFRSRRIKWWQSAATGDQKGLVGPTHNTLSSQVACINTLMPLREDAAALTAILKAIDPDVEKVVAVDDGHSNNPSLVELEWVGSRGYPSLEGTSPTRGQRVTSSDAFLVARLKTGLFRGYLMEWKYVEDGAEKDKGQGDEGKARLRRYSPLFKKVFKPGLQLSHFLIDPIYQLVRLCLLARKIVDDHQLNRITSVRAVLVCPRTNSAYRNTRPGRRIEELLKTTTVAGTIRNALIDPDSFIDAAPEELVSAVRQLASPPSERSEWLTYMRRRYGW